MEVSERMSTQTPLLKRIGTRIREEGKKNYNRSNNSTTRNDYFTGVEEGLSKAFSILKTIIQYEFPQYYQLITEIEKRTEY